MERNKNSNLKSKLFGPIVSRTTLHVPISALIGMKRVAEIMQISLLFK